MDDFNTIMDDFNKKCNLLIAIMFFTGIGMLVYAESDMANKFRDACISIKGTPVHDGKQWECLK